MHFVQQKYNFNINETEPKMENPAHSFRDTNLKQHLRQGSV